LPPLFESKGSPSFFELPETSFSASISHFRETLAGKPAKSAVHVGRDEKAMATWQSDCQMFPITFDPEAWRPNCHLAVASNILAGYRTTWRDAGRLVGGCDFAALSSGLSIQSLAKYEAALAEKEGLRELSGDVLQGNQRMLEMCRALGFAISPDPEDLSIRKVRLTLPCGLQEAAHAAAEPAC
jgi:hypothetical protein